MTVEAGNGRLNSKEKKTTEEGGKKGNFPERERKTRGGRGKRPKKIGWGIGVFTRGSRDGALRFGGGGKKKKTGGGKLGGGGLDKGGGCKIYWEPIKGGSPGQGREKYIEFIREKRRFHSTSRLRRLEQ